MLRTDVRENKVFRCDGVSGDPSQHCQLPGMSHRVGEWSLQHHLRCDVMKLCSNFKVPGKILQYFVEVNDSCFKRQPGWGIRTTDEESSSVSQHAVHVSDQFMWSSNVVWALERGELRWSTTKRLLCAICEGCQEMLQHFSLIIHVSFTEQE